jgi:hypothetical protein
MEPIILVNCEECGKEITIEYRLCTGCQGKLNGYESDEFDQDRPSRYDD